ncbi:MAG: hypothetical protein AAF519_13840 [Bacteroidota bacterium]
MKTIFPFAFLLLTLLGCNDSENINPKPLPPTTGIDLSDPEVGQTMRYLRYESHCNQNDFEFSGDTLNVEIVEDKGLLYLKEYFTPGSVLEADTSLTRLEKRDGYILVKERFQSPLLYFYGNDSLFFNKPITANLQQWQCRLEIDAEPFVGDEIGQLDRFEFGDILIENKLGVSCIPLIFELDGFLVYDSEFLYLSHTISEDTVQGFVAADW